MGYKNFVSGISIAKQRTTSALFPTIPPLELMIALLALNLLLH